MAESRIEKVAINAGASFAASGVSIICKFFSQMIFVRTLGEDYLGINGLFTNILSILCLADLGMNTVMLYSLYQPLADHNTEKIAALVKYFKKMYGCVAAVILAVGLICIPFLDFIVKTDQPVENLELYYLLFLLKTVVSYLFVYRTTLLIADQKQYMLKRYEIIFELIKFICQTTVLIFRRNYVMYLAIEIITVGLMNYTGNRKVCEIYPYTRKQRGRTENDSISDVEKREIIVNLKALFAYRIGSAIQGNTDAILISVFVGTVEVGYYSNYMLVVTALVNILSLLYGSIKATLGNFIVTYKSAEARYEVFEVLEKVCFWLVSFCSICFWVLMQDFIGIAFGSDYLLGKLTLVLIVTNFYTSNIRQNIWAYRETMGFFHKTRYITIVTSTMNVILSLAGGYIWGINGIIAATIVARLLYALWKEPLILYREGFKKSASIYYRRYMIDAVLTCAVGVLTSLIAWNIPITNIYSKFVCECFICLVIPNVFMALYIIPSREGKYLIESLKRVCGRH